MQGKNGINYVNFNRITKVDLISNKYVNTPRKKTEHDG